MTVKDILEWEINNLKKLNKFQLPHYYKKIGIWLFVVSFIALFINAFSLNDIEIRAIIKYSMLIGLLLISISKEKIEDELVIKLRMQSYTFAFIMGVISALLLPFVDYIFDYFLKTKEAIITDMGDWEILWILLCIQVLYFELLKRLHR